jgi:DNA-binding Lrp family transcriptional regulator
MAERNDGSPRTIRHPGTTRAVLDYLRVHPDQVIPYEEIARYLGLTSRPHIVNAVGHLVRRGVADIERPIKGTVIYHSGKVDYDLGKTLAQDVPIEPETVIEITPRDIEDENKRYGWEASAAPIVEAMPIYEYVGKMERFNVIRGVDDQLYVAIPLMEFLNADQ